MSTTTAATGLQSELCLAAPADAGAQTEAVREIDAMSYEAMLRLVRNAPLGHRLFRGAVGIHFHAVLRLKRQATPPEDRITISKRVGF